MSRWMLVSEDMNWEQVKFQQSGGEAVVIQPKKRKERDCKILKKNDTTKVYRVQDKLTEEIFDVVDFQEIDSFFEENNIIFQNRRGLHNEVRRYIEFSLK